MTCTFSYNIYVLLHIESNQKGLILGKGKNLMAKSQKFKQKLTRKKGNFGVFFWPKT